VLVDSALLLIVGFVSRVIILLIIAQELLINTKLVGFREIIFSTTEKLLETIICLSVNVILLNVSPVTLYTKLTDFNEVPRPISLLRGSEKFILIARSQLQLTVNATLPSLKDEHAPITLELLDASIN